MRAKARHVFVPDADVADWTGRPFCRECPLPKDHDIHQLPPTPADVAAHEARRLGEPPEET